MVYNSQFNKIMNNKIPMYAVLIFDLPRLHFFLHCFSPLTVGASSIGMVVAASK